MKSTRRYSDPNREPAILSRLRGDLAFLKQKFQAAQELKLKWLPDSTKSKSGEVIGGTIYVYEEDEATALDTLRHEFIEYILSTELETPYKRIINKLITAFEEEMYARKERLVERLRELIS